VQAACDAIGPVGGTICLAGQTFTESVTCTLHHPVTLRGVPGSTQIVGGVRIYAYADLSVSGIAFDGGTGAALVVDHVASQLSIADSTFTSAMTNASYESGSLVVTVGNGNCTTSIARVTVANTGTGDALRVYNASQGGSEAVAIDRAILSGVRTGTGSALSYFVYDGGGTSSTAQITVTNSWLHDAHAGFGISGTGTTRLHVYSVLLENDTITSNDTGILHTDTIWSDPTSATLGYYNAIVDGNATGVELDGVEQPMATSGNNLYFGNTTNFAGSAVDGTGDVKADPLLTTATPPGLGAGSPAIGTGDAAHAPDHDFYGTARGASIDIGAVQH